MKDHENDVLGSVWAAATEVVCMNCSVLSFDSFMFCDAVISTTSWRGELSEIFRTWVRTSNTSLKVMLVEASLL